MIPVAVSRRVTTAENSPESLCIRCSCLLSRGQYYQKVLPPIGERLFSRQDSRMIFKMGAVN